MKRSLGNQGRIWGLTGETNRCATMTSPMAGLNNFSKVETATATTNSFIVNTSFCELSILCHIPDIFACILWSKFNGTIKLFCCQLWYKCFAHCSSVCLSLNFQAFLVITKITSGPQVKRVSTLEKWRQMPDGAQPPNAWSLYWERMAKCCSTSSSSSPKHNENH